MYNCEWQLDLGTSDSRDPERKKRVKIRDGCYVQHMLGSAGAT